MASTSRPPRAAAPGGGRSAAARHSRIAAELRDRIETGRLAAHQRLPSELELSRAHGVARMTVRQALEALEREGVIYRRPGIGSFVAEPRIGMGIGSLSEELLRTGHLPGARLLRAERARATPLVAEALGLGEDEEVLITVRLRSADGEPLAVETSHWSQHLMPDLFENLTEGSLWALARDRYGLTPTRIDARLETITLDERTAERLRTHEGAAALLLTRCTYDERGRCFEFARDVYRGDRAAFRIRSAVPPDGGWCMIAR